MKNVVFCPCGFNLHVKLILKTLKTENHEYQGFIIRTWCYSYLFLR